MSTNNGSTAATPLVYGYICADLPDEIEIALWRKEIDLFCDARSLTLGATIIDLFEPNDQLDRPALKRLYDVLAESAAYAVVVVHLDHLSTDNYVRSEIRRLIRRSGSQVMCVHEVPENFKADGA